jgi:hypothetical protein
MVPMGDTAWGKLIHGKNLKLKISCQTPFNIQKFSWRVKLV